MLTSSAPPSSDSAADPSATASELSPSQPIPSFASRLPPRPESLHPAEVWPRPRTGPSATERLRRYLDPQAVIQWDAGEIAIAPLPVYSPAMLANAYFFGHPRWGKKYLNQEHRGAAFCDRWHHALGRLESESSPSQSSPSESLEPDSTVENPFAPRSPELAPLSPHAPPDRVGWDGKVVVDLGCGPGNLFAALGGQPADIIGVDISPGALRRSRQLGYLALLADAHHLPLRSQIADVVVANALLHHCDHVARVLAEAARLVKPGGLLITDLDPQRSAWERQGWGLWVEQLRWPRLGWGDAPEEMAWRIATEIHNRQPGVGIETHLYQKVLEPLGFDVQLYPHNPGVGAELFAGDRGRSPLKIRVGQRLSGVDPEGPEAAQSILCIAQRH